MAFVKTWNEAAPAGTDLISNGDNEIRDFKYAIRERLAIDHVFDADESGVTNIGTHKQVQMFESAGNPSYVVDTGIIYTKLAGSNTELFYMDETGAVVQLTAVGYINGAAIPLSSLTLTGTITYVIDGGGAAISTGIKGDLEIPFGCTINRATLLADTSCTAAVNIWKVAYASYPATVANKITSSTPPTITTGVKSQDSTLASWTTSITAGDCLRFNVDSNDNATRLTLSLKYTRT